MVVAIPTPANNGASAHEHPYGNDANDPDAPSDSRSHRCSPANKDGPCAAAHRFARQGSNRALVPSVRSDSVWAFQCSGKGRQQCNGRPTGTADAMNSIHPESLPLSLATTAARERRSFGFSVPGWPDSSQRADFGPPFVFVHCFREIRLHAEPSKQITATNRAWRSINGCTQRPRSDLPRTPNGYVPSLICAAFAGVHVRVGSTEYSRHS